MEKEMKITAPDGCEIEKVEMVDGVAVVTFREKERKLPKSCEEFCRCTASRKEAAMNNLEFAQEKAKRCKFFSWSPLCTALYCRKKGIELKSVIHGIEWDGKECLNCTKWILKGGEK